MKKKLNDKLLKFLLLHEKLTNILTVLGTDRLGWGREGALPEAAAC